MCCSVVDLATIIAPQEAVKHRTDQPPLEKNSKISATRKIKVSSEWKVTALKKEAAIFGISYSKKKPTTLLPTKMTRLARIKTMAMEPKMRKICANVIIRLRNK